MFRFQFGNARWRAVLVFERMYKKNGLKKTFMKWLYPGEDSPDLDNDLAFIKELILGRPLSGKVGEVQNWVLHGVAVATHTYIYMHTRQASVTSLYFAVQDYKSGKKLFFYKVTILLFRWLILIVHLYVILQKIGLVYIWHVKLLALHQHQAD